MRSRRQAFVQAEAGFTLLEMLIVLAIIGLASAIVLPRVLRPTDGLVLQTAAEELRAALQATRWAAMRTSREATLVIDVERRRIVSTQGYSSALAPDIEAKLTFASVVRSHESDGGFRYFPDGSSTGGYVTLSLRELHTNICVDWLTGQARVDRTC
jgi:general secretion pathway protein H